MLQLIRNQQRELQAQAVHVAVKPIRDRDLRHPRVLAALATRGITSVPAMIANGHILMGERQITSALIDACRDSSRVASRPDWHARAEHKRDDHSELFNTPHRQLTQDGGDSDDENEILLSKHQEYSGFE